MNHAAICDNTILDQNVNWLQYENFRNISNCKIFIDYIIYNGLAGVSTLP